MLGDTSPIRSLARAPLHRRESAKAEIHDPKPASIPRIIANIGSWRVLAHSSAKLASALMTVDSTAVSRSEGDRQGPRGGRAREFGIFLGAGSRLTALSFFKNARTRSPRSPAGTTAPARAPVSKPHCRGRPIARDRRF